MDKLTDGDTVKAAKVTPTSGVSASKAPPKDKDGNPIRLGDYVIFYNKHNDKLRGIVRWIGSNESVQPDGTPIVGIESVSYNQLIAYLCVTNIYLPPLNIPSLPTWTINCIESGLNWFCSNTLLSYPVLKGLRKTF